jgi:hypothetical protein
MADQQPDAPPAPISLDERVERLSRIVSTRTLEGWTVVDRNEREAWAVLDLPGKPVNHTLHAIISLFSCGLWLIVWLILSLTQQKQQRVRISIDSYGNLLEEKVVLS